jgi:flagellar protein FliL
MAEERRDAKAIEAEEEEPKKGGMGKLIMIIVLVVVLGGGGAAGYFFRQKIPFVSQYFAKHEEGEETAKKKTEVGPILPLDPFVFNLSGNQTKFAKVSVAVEMKDTKVMEEAKKMIPVIRDGILTVLSAKSPDVLLDMASRDKIKKELQEHLKGVFHVENGVQAVYITDMVIQ